MSAPNFIFQNDLFLIFEKLQGKDYKNLLITAIQDGKLDQVEFLLYTGNVEHFKTNLDMFTLAEDTYTLEDLLQPIIEEAKKYNQTKIITFIYQKLIFNALKTNNLNQFENYLQLAEININNKNHLNELLLYIASKHGSYEIVEYLVSNGAEITAENLYVGLKYQAGAQNTSCFIGDQFKSYFYLLDKVSDFNVYAPIGITNILETLNKSQYLKATEISFALTCKLIGNGIYTYCSPDKASTAEYIIHHTIDSVSNIITDKHLKEQLLFMKCMSCTYIPPLDYIESSRIIGRDANSIFNNFYKEIIDLLSIRESDQRIVYPSYSQCKNNLGTQQCIGVMNKISFEDNEL